MSSIDTNEDAARPLSRAEVSELVKKRAGIGQRIAASWHAFSEHPQTDQPINAIVARRDDNGFCLLSGLFYWSHSTKRWIREANGQPLVLAPDVDAWWMTEDDLLWQIEERHEPTGIEFITSTQVPT